MTSEAGKVAVITGAARGIGFACASQLGVHGFKVALVDLDQAQLAASAEDLRRQGTHTLELAGDVSDYSLAQSQLAQVLAKWGRVDLLINCAGISQPKSVLEITESEWDRTVAINLKGCFNWCKAVAQPMVSRQDGRIINISSISANTGGSPTAVSRFAYAAAKAGVLGLTRGLAKDLAPYVAVNGICPGMIETQLTAGLIARSESLIRQSIPMGRLGSPADVAVVATFLATVQPNFMTGEIIDVDGGQWVN